jgi:hypothetical protein
MGGRTRLWLRKLSGRYANGADGDSASAVTYAATDNDPVRTEPIPDPLGIAKWLVKRLEVIASEGLEPIPILGVEVVADTAQSVHDEFRQRGDISIETTGSVMISAMAGIMHVPYAGPSVTAPIRELKDAGLKDGHHVIQDAAVRDLPGYDRNLAPGVQLRGPSTTIGTPHYLATLIQRAGGGGTYAAERRIAYKALRRAGFNEAMSRAAILEADSYFGSIGVTPSTPTRIPGNRR